MDNKKTFNLPPKNLPIKPLHIKEIEMREATKERLDLISEEFRDGFDFLQNFPKSVTFFGSSQLSEDSPYYKKARELSAKITTELGYSIVTGGGPGIMEAANRGSYENNGKSLGLTIEIPEGQAINPYLTNHIDFYYFFARKVCLSFSAEAYVFFPGGFGTMDELFEILTLVQTHKIYSVPIILVGSDFWNKIDEMMRNEMLTKGMIDANDLKLYKITDDLDEVVKTIKEAPIRDMSSFSEEKVEKLKEKSNEN